ncbi:hypothetical protein M407DRAFT_29134 [Tulasnella calospora MUT 4182]|uniref:Uncharacterized protein n=1 Tax=Tulasnella calospora MUT 4182 TaxID=1051891 RepID=A0A0C3Q9I3_9AGAM|nr:hypothetical protein M407DRAFT_29134 [Tulasnella calospora MUT 4182]
MLPVPHRAPYHNQIVYGHQFSGHFQPPIQQQGRPLFYPPTPEQPPSQQVIASTSTFPSPILATQEPYYYQQPTSGSNNWLPQQSHHPAQSLGQFDDISPAFKGKAFIYDCMVRALENLSPDGASVKEIFDHVWLHNRAFILARSRDGDTEAGRRASTKNTIVNYLSTSPAFESIGRNRWVLTGKRHGADKRGGKISRSTKRRPRNSSHDDHGGGSAAAPSSSNSSSSSPSSVVNSSPDIPNRPGYHEITPGQPGFNENHNLHFATSATFANNPVVANRPATTPLPLSNGLIQGPTQASSSSTSSVSHHTHGPELHQHQPQQHARREGPIVAFLPSHAAPLEPGMSGTNTTITGVNNSHQQRESFSYGQPARRTPSTTTNATTPAPKTGGGTRRSFDAVPQVLPPLPPRTWHPDNFDPFATPVQTPAPHPAPNPTTISTSAMIPPCTAPSGHLFQIPSNMSYYETPSIFTYETPSIPTPAAPTSYALQENNPSSTMLPQPSISSSYCPPPTLEELFAQVDPQGGCAGNSIPLVRRTPHHLDHLQQQAQRFHDSDPFAAPPGFV